MPTYFEVLILRFKNIAHNWAWQLYAVKAVIWDGREGFRQLKILTYLKFRLNANKTSFPQIFTITIIIIIIISPPLAWPTSYLLGQQEQRQGASALWARTLIFANWAIRSSATHQFSTGFLSLPLSLYSQLYFQLIFFCFELLIFWY